MEPSKGELRSKALRDRDALDEAARNAFAARLSKVGPSFVSDFSPTVAKPVASLYVPIGSEPDAMPLALVLHAAGIPLVLPVDWSHGAPLVYRRWAPGDRLVAGPMGIYEPLDDAPDVDPDVLFIPLAAFDRLGQRLGYGAGNVDSTLRAMRRRKSVRAIGVAYAVQEQPAIPVERHDEPVDVVITDREVILCQR
ncbi:5-formyltetrahydrofolate cyclo-ligase [Lichenihabitans psoromatis]|uniref:5-formyltetrahydrofolate cyclo-ligase n=1 Tax=Lichenihabitans psoromatis TaxID=2528642 RepID=UPI0010384EB5|nr:5-formyltetrahydrofolate cyclo-ligase [Lichenihabitans psoromatis]